MVYLPLRHNFHGQHNLLVRRRRGRADLPVPPRLLGPYADKVGPRGRRRCVLRPQGVPARVCSGRDVQSEQGAVRRWDPFLPLRVIARKAEAGLGDVPCPVFSRVDALFFEGEAGERKWALGRGGGRVEG